MERQSTPIFMWVDCRSSRGFLLKIDIITFESMEMLYLPQKGAGDMQL